MTKRSRASHTYDAVLLRRAKVLGVIYILLALAVAFITLTLLPDKSRATLPLILCGILILLSLPMILLKQSLFVYWFVVLNVGFGLGFVAAFDPLDGVVSSGSWPLYFLWPPIIMLVLRDIRIYVLVAILTIALFILIPQLEMNGIIPVSLTTPLWNLRLIWSISLVSMIMLFVLLAVIGLDEHHASQKTLAALHELDESHFILQTNAQTLQVTNQNLQAALDRQHQLQRDLEQLGTPLIDIGNQVVLLPLLGTLDAQRLISMQSTVPTIVHESHVNHVIIDFTGSVIADLDLVEKIESFIMTFELLGIKTTITGISKQLAKLFAQSMQLNFVGRSGRLDVVLQAALREKI